MNTLSNLKSGPFEFTRLAEPHNAELIHINQCGEELRARNPAALAWAPAFVRQWK